MPARREKVDVSLFPFLSVLCTVIAVMVVLGIMILNTRVVAKAEQAYKKLPDGGPDRQQGSEDTRGDGLDSRRYRQLEEEVARLKRSLDRRKGRLAMVTQKFKALQAAGVPEGPGGGRRWRGRGPGGPTRVLWCP